MVSPISGATTIQISNGAVEATPERAPGGSALRPWHRLRGRGARRSGAGRESRRPQHGGPASAVCRRVDRLVWGRRICRGGAVFLLHGLRLFLRRAASHVFHYRGGTPVLLFLHRVCCSGKLV